MEALKQSPEHEDPGRKQALSCAASSALRSSRERVVPERDEEPPSHSLEVLSLDRESEEVLQKTEGTSAGPLQAPDRRRREEFRTWQREARQRRRRQG